MLHELVHAIVDQVAPAPMPGILEEFVGSAVQFELMDPALRHTVLSNYDGIYGFNNLDAELALEYSIDPETFAVRAYRYEQKHGGPNLVRDIIMGRVRLDDLS